VSVGLHLSVDGRALLGCERDLRCRWVRAEVDALDLEQVVLGVRAVLQRVLAGHLERLVQGGLGAAEEAGRFGGGGRCQEGGGDGEELHRDCVCLTVCL